MSDMAELYHQKDEVKILTQLFQKEIEDIKNAKTDSDNKLAELYAKNIKVVPTETLVSSSNRNILENFNLHDKVLLEDKSAACLI